ncbi:hypothetical protein K6H10_003803 [Candida tropicalis]
MCAFIGILLGVPFPIFCYLYGEKIRQWADRRIESKQIRRDQKNLEKLKRKNATDIIPQPVKQLTFDELKAFPLPKAVETLPTSYLQDFSDNKQLLQGYIRQLEAYSTKQQEVVRTLQQADDILENVVYSQLIKDYEKVIDKINQQIKSINIIYQEFINLETYQYQLLSSNFNQDNLKAKFKKLIEENNQESLDIVKNFNDRSHGSEISDESFGTMIENFKNSRKLYHFRKEKLNRWEEERVSGFL